jgi:hypothetical protein
VIEKFCEKGEDWQSDQGQFTAWRDKRSKRKQPTR